MKNYLIPVLALSFSAISGYSDSSRPHITFRSGSENAVVDQELNIDEKISLSRARLQVLAKGNKSCLEAYDLFCRELEKAYKEEKALSSTDINQILAGLEFAAQKHQLQVRKNAEKTPYIAHPIGVATHLMNIGRVRDPSVIIAALLHDTVEDTETSFAEIEAQFGSDVASYVKELTDDKSLSTQNRKRLQVIHAAHKSAGAAQIKLADKFYNLNDLSVNPPVDWSRTRIDAYYQWAKSVVDRLPAANDHLKEAVDEMIHKYWETQGKAEEAK